MKNATFQSSNILLFFDQSSTQSPKPQNLQLKQEKEANPHMRSWKQNLWHVSRCIDSSINQLIVWALTKTGSLQFITGLFTADVWKWIAELLKLQTADQKFWPAKNPTDGPAARSSIIQAIDQTSQSPKAEHQTAAYLVEIQPAFKTIYLL